MYFLVFVATFQLSNFPTSFLAASLKVKDWQALVDDLTTKKIRVTIEAK